MHAAANEQEARQRPRGGMLDHLVDLELAVARAGLEEEVVRQILDEVAGREDVVAVPGTALRVLRQRSLAAGQEVVRIADPLQRGERRLRRAAAVDGVAPVSIVLIVVATSSTWPNSSAAMLETRSKNGRAPWRLRKLNDWNV